MDKFLVPAVAKPLDGEVEIAGAKNAVLAIMPAALLADGISEISNVPHLKDMKTMSDVLRIIGCRIDGENHKLRIDTRGANHLEAPYELVKTMRASFYVLGPLVARFGRCRVSLPGGCAWGPRPIDLHLKGLEALGAKIQGRGTRTLIIQGVESLTPGKGETIADRIEAGTFLCGAVITRGRVKVTHMVPEHIMAVLNVFKEIGCDVAIGDSWVEVDARNKSLKPISVTTLPYPGFPTDLQAPLMATLASIEGNSLIQDTIYHDRFTHIAELKRLGADIQLNGNTATIIGGKSLEGADVMASDLRASAALVLSGLIAEGETTISRIYHLDRGYEDFEAKMAKLGATVSRIRPELA